MRLLEVNTFGTLVAGTERCLEISGRALLQQGVILHHIYLHPLSLGQRPLIPEVPHLSLPALSPHLGYDQLQPETEVARNRLLTLVRDFRPDVVHLNNVYSPDLLLSTLREVPVVRTVHDYRFLCLRLDRLLPGSKERCQHTLGASCVRRRCLPEGHLGWGWGWGWVRFLDICHELERYKSLPLLSCKSFHMKGVLVKHGFAMERIHRVPLCVDLPPLGRRSETQLRPPRLLYAGRLSREKGIDELLRACAMLKRGSFSLDIAGTGAQETKLMKLARELGLSEVTTFHGHLDYDRLTDLYQVARAVVIPSLWDEPFGLTGLEALAHATPVIAYNVGGVPEWLRHEETGKLVTRGSIEELAGAMEALLAAPGHAARLGHNGRIDVLARFSPEAVAPQLLGMLESAAAQS